LAREPPGSFFAVALGPPEGAAEAALAATGVASAPGPAPGRTDGESAIGGAGVAGGALTVTLAYPAEDVAGSVATTG